MTDSQNKCAICKNTAKSSTQSLNQIYDCKQCGSYIASIIDSPRLNDDFRSVISGHVRDSQANNMPFHLTQDIVDKIERMPALTVHEKITKMMRWIAKQTTYPGKLVKIDINDNPDNPELISICYAKDNTEIRYFIDYLKEKNFIYRDSSSLHYRITVDGFDYLESERKKIDSDLCFCAMSFSQEHRYIYDKFIQPAVNMAGYKIIRVDEDPHNEGVVDKILALMRRSKFVISDLTGNKHGVYYEAGFAKGQEREVVHTCEDEDFNQIHFDVRHLNVLKWNKNNISEAVEKLRWRIEGTIGRGSLSQKSLLEVIS